MAMSVTVTPLPLKGPFGKEVQKVQIDWTSAADGSATATVNLYGYVHKIVTDPSATAPTANYDITLLQHGVDMLAGILADRHTANNEIVYGIAKNGSDIHSAPIFLAGDHTFTIANAGDSKIGTVYLYMTESL